MRILHTSDWHIGKRLNGRDRLGEQQAVLEEIVEICDREGVELVLVAGDVFDTFLPSAEAEDLFYESVKKMAGKDRCVLIISGNHDDNVRLTAATALSEEQGIYIYGNAEHTPKLCSGRALAAVESGAHHMVFRNSAGDSVFVNVLPYPNEARFKEDKIEGETFYDKMRRWILSGEEKNTQKFPSAFLSHLFIAGGKVSEGEREIDLGGARAVPLELLPGSSYTALGHLHKRQHFKNNVYYSGSILQYAFDEAGTKKSVIVFDLNENGAQNIREIPLTRGKQLVRLAQASVADAVELIKKYPDCYIELTLYLSEPLVSSQVRELKDANDGLVSIIPAIQGETAQVRAEFSRKQMAASELFCEYYKSLYAQQPPEDLTQLFLSITEESDET